MKRLISYCCLCIFFSFPSFSQRIVNNSAELSKLLSQDKELGDIYLAGTLFEIEDLTVKAGGVVRSKDGITPFFVGKSFKAEKRVGVAAESGYWKIKVPGFARRDFFVFDTNFNSLPISSKVGDNNAIGLRECDIMLLGGENNHIKIPIQDVPLLKNRSSANLKNCVLKLSCWYLCMDVIDLYSDAKYLYGRIESKLYYNHIKMHPKNPVYLRFFNFPYAGEGIYIDGNDFLHVPDSIGAVRVCTSSRILNLTGDRTLTFKGISFMGSSNAVRIYRGSGKHFKGCTFKNCGSGIVCNRGELNLPGDNSVESCSFDNLYNNIAVQFLGCDNVRVINNTISHTGLYNKGGSLIDVSGKDFLVEGNHIEDFSYIGIRVGNTRKEGVEKISGKVINNIIDNKANYSVPEKLLMDGGGIYIFTHNDDTEISGNIVRNIGAKECDERGIFLDDGAYNVKVLRNLIYNIYPGDEAIHARYVSTYSNSCMNNVFEGNIIVGDCIIAGNRKGKGDNTRIENNYIDGAIKTQGDNYVKQAGTKIISTDIGEMGELLVDNRVRIRMKDYPETIRRVVNNRKRLN